MAIGNITQWGSRVGLDQIYETGFEDAVYRNNQLLGLSINGSPVFPERPMTTGQDNRWLVNSAGNTSVATFTEGAAAPQPVAQTYVTLEANPVYFWAWTRISGHVRDAVRNNGAMPGLDPIENEFMAGFEDIRDLMNTTFMGSTSGVEQIVDSGNTVFGVAQGSNAWHAASETAVGGALTQAALRNISETARDNDKGSRWNLMLGPHNQLTNYGALIGNAGASNNSARFEFSTIGGGRLDIGPDPAQYTFEGRPFIGIGDFTDTVIVGIDTRMTRFGPNWELLTARRFDVRGPDMAGDDDVFELSTARVLLCRLVKFNWKLTGVTA